MITDNADAPETGMPTAGPTVDPLIAEARAKTATTHVMRPVTSTITTATLMLRAQHGGDQHARDRDLA